METNLPYLAHLCLGPLILIIAIIFYKYPPKTINHVYGYRTNRSMRSQPAWDEAQRFSSRWMLIMAIITTGYQVVSIFIMPYRASTLSSAIVLCVLLIAVLPITERHLKQRFDGEGKPLDYPGQYGREE